MAQVTRILSFAVPRHPDVPAPRLADILVHHAEDSPFQLDAGSDVFKSTGDTIIWREPLPVRGWQQHGRLFGFRDGLIFQPNTARGIREELDRQVLEPLRMLARVMAMDFKIKDEFGPHAGGGKDAVEMAEGAEELLDKTEPGELPDDLYATFHSFREHAMRHPKALVMPFADLVEVAVSQTETHGMFARLSIDSGPQMTLSFKARDGQRSTYSVVTSALPLIPDGNAAAHTGKTLYPDEKKALSFMFLRAHAEVGYFMRQVEDEYFAPGFRAAIIAAFAKATTAQFLSARKLMQDTLEQERNRTGAKGPHIARAVLARMGEIAPYFRALPFEKHGLVNAIAELERQATAATGFE